MRLRERVKVVEEGSWTLYRTKKSTGELEQRRRDVAAATDGGMTWWGGRKPAEVWR
jgi:hypothetical protein